MRRILIISTQILGLVLVSELGYWAAGWLGLPIPGNVLGMLLLFGLLATGVVPLWIVEAAAMLLLRHLAFFFIPLAVGLMGFADLLREHGLAILAALLVSAVAGIYAAAFASQWLAAARTKETPWTSR